MSRSFRRRFIVTVALLSHLAAAFFVHVPMAYAGMSATTVQSVAVAHQPPPCPDHATAAVTSDHQSDCKGTFCKCQCAHTQALAIVPMLTPAFVAHSPVVSYYPVPPAPDCATSFFRPPI